MSVPIPEKLRCSSGISPVKMSQIPSKNVPRFFGSFIGRLHSANTLSVFVKTRVTRRRLKPPLHTERAGNIQGVGGVQRHGDRAHKYVRVERARDLLFGVLAGQTFMLRYSFHRLFSLRQGRSENILWVLSTGGDSKLFISQQMFRLPSLEQ